jgi:hypothetical protein
LKLLLYAFERLPQQSETYQQMIGSPREVFFWTMTLEYGIMVTRAKLAWTEMVMRRITQEDV